MKKLLITLASTALVASVYAQAPAPITAPVTPAPAKVATTPAPTAAKVDKVTPKTEKAPAKQAQTGTKKVAPAKM